MITDLNWRELHGPRSNSNHTYNGPSKALPLSLFDVKNELKQKSINVNNFLSAPCINSNEERTTHTQN